MNIKNRLLINRLTIPLLRRTVRSLSNRKSSLRLLNRLYVRLDSESRALVYELFAKAHRDTTASTLDARWEVFFCGKRLVIPVRGESIWLDWDICLSVIGHDLEVKEFYERVLGAEGGLDLFVDVGANYGTHSLMFLANDIATVTIEPNPSCHEYFLHLCAMNGHEPNLLRKAAGDGVENVMLCFDERETWSGRIEERASGVLSASGRKAITVEQVRLDDYVEEWIDKKILMKLDTEGHEENVLAGAKRVIRECMPIIVFESLSVGRGSELFRLFGRHGYSIHGLTRGASVGNCFISLEEYLEYPGSNFLAIPIGCDWFFVEQQSRAVA